MMNRRPRSYLLNSLLISGRGISGLIPDSCFMMTGFSLCRRSDALTFSEEDSEKITTISPMNFHQSVLTSLLEMILLNYVLLFILYCFYYTASERNYQWFFSIFEKPTSFLYSKSRTLFARDSGVRALNLSVFSGTAGIIRPERPDRGFRRCLTRRQ